MRYDESDRESKNVEDRRGQGGGGFGFPMGGGRSIQIPMGGGRAGGFSFTTLLIIGAIMLMLGINPLDFIFGGGNPNMGQVPQMPRMDGGPRPSQRSPFDLPGQRTQAPTPATEAGAPNRNRDELATFTKRVLADTEDVWNRVFQQIGRRYQEPTLVMFSGSTRSACGPGASSMGPFYCPLDQKVYVDLTFYEELQRRFRAPGDFAQAYVIAHEVGHHVQTLLGITEKVQEMKASNPRAANQIQVRMELQADCLAGVWAALNHQMKNRLQPGDVEEGLNAANAIGDDMIQKRTQGYVVPDAFTHGSAAQRVRWFRQGLDSGRIQSCDTFNAQTL